MKKIIMFLMVALGCTTVFATGSTTSTAAVKAIVLTGAAVTETTFTLEQLAAFDGKNGTTAYVALDGIVYDVTKAKGWKNGNHNGIQAGQDISKYINKSPHGKGVLKNLQRIGKLADKK